MTDHDALSTARAYHDRWTSGDFDGAAALLAADLAVEVPINEYEGREAFAAAVRGFGSLVARTELLSELGGPDEAMLLYDMEVDGLGEMRVAEHFTVADGRIVRVRQVHDTAALRAAGFAA
jgi:ketosteroid isomerase-like protein